jgi:protein gp37
VRIDSAGEPHEWNGNIKFVEKHLLDPLKWREPKRIFVNSMSDLFHENVTDAMRNKIFAVMALCPHHTFQILTKRPERMLKYLAWAKREDWIQGEITELCLGVLSDGLHARAMKSAPDGWGGIPLKQVHLGISCENQASADERIPLLLQTPAAIRFISAEPLLGPIDLLRTLRPGQMWDWLTGERETTSEKRVTAYIDWVIAGGESGNDFRPMNPEWAESLQVQCRAAGVPFFMKQMSGRTPAIGASLIPGHLQVREFPTSVCTQIQPNGGSILIHGA